MTYADYYKNKLIQSQEELDEVYENINNFKIPYKYFKKLNILPLDIVEGEIDKYFDITTLLIENFSEAKHIDCKIKYLYDDCNIVDDLKPNLLKYYNNFPCELLNNSNYNFYNFIMNNYKKYKEANVITPCIDMDIRGKLVDIINNNILRKTNNIKFNTQHLIEAEARNKYRIPVRRFPIDSQLLITEYPNCYYSEIIIVKICKKIIKYQDRHSPVVRQMKIEKLEDYLNDRDYKLVDRFDRQKRYCLVNDNNIYLGH